MWRPAHGDVEKGRIEAKEGVEMTQWLMALEEEGALQRLARFRRRRMIPSFQGPRQLRWCRRHPKSQKG